MAQGGTAQRRVFLAGVAVGLASAGLGWLGARAWQRAFAPRPPDVHTVSTFEAIPSTSAADPTRTGPPPALPPALAEGGQPEAPPATREKLPVFDKLVAKPLSHEPHQVLGAWDEDASSSSPGARRAFVLAVSPDQSDASLEALARDVRAQNRDARLLDVRVYDDASAAMGPRVLDGGRNARQHLVAVVQRNEAAGLDVIRVRGRSVEP